MTDKADILERIDHLETTLSLVLDQLHSLRRKVERSEDFPARGSDVSKPASEVRKAVGS